MYPASVQEAAGATYFLCRRGGQKLVGCVGAGEAHGQPAGQIGEMPVVLGPMDNANATVMRRLFGWTAPRPIGMRTSIGLGDRLGLATPGHIRAVRGLDLGAVLAQQSIREMTRARRTPQDVIDDATWGVVQEGFYKGAGGGFGADADHVRTPQDLAATVPAGFCMFTLDLIDHVEASADTMDAATLGPRFDSLPFDRLSTTAAGLLARYSDRTLPLAGEGEPLRLDRLTLVRAAVKYGGAVAHAAAMHRRLQSLTGSFELELSVDESGSPTSPAEHYFIAAELRRLGVPFVSLAPRFVGRFEKGVDYIGELAAFTASLAAHVRVMRTLGPYKLSIHSGSDKFSIYPIIAELAGGLVHLKTAGTSYLEALRAVAVTQPELFRQVLECARRSYDLDRASYHVSADVARVPPPETLADEQLPALLNDFHARQMLHVTFGSVLAELGQPLRDTLDAHEDLHYRLIETHIRRHAIGILGRSQ